ncbi:MAG: hypothetical protein Q7W51_00765 [Coriobacteriia bacterium]|nr:hypothetical protein [Coriobacteriia bacterium]
MSTRLARALVAATLLGLLALTVGCRAEGTPQSSPNSPSSAGLVEEPKEHDGTEVTFTGEVIGEAMVRGDNAWLHINDDAYYLENVEEGAQLGGYNSGMAVWLPAALVEDIEYYGDYKHEGDIVQVTGTFNAACPEHGGDLEIHATSLTVVQTGREVVDEIRPAKVAWAAGLALLALGLYLVNRLWQRGTEPRRR